MKRFGRGKNGLFKESDARTFSGRPSFSGSFSREMELGMKAVAKLKITAPSKLDRARTRISEQAPEMSAANKTNIRAQSAYGGPSASKIRRGKKTKSPTKGRADDWEVGSDSVFTSTSPSPSAAALPRSGSKSPKKPSSQDAVLQDSEVDTRAMAWIAQEQRDVKQKAVKARRPSALEMSAMNPDDDSSAGGIDMKAIAELNAGLALEAAAGRQADAAGAGGGEDEPDESVAPPRRRRRSSSEIVVAFDHNRTARAKGRRASIDLNMNLAPRHTPKSKSPPKSKSAPAMGPGRLHGGRRNSSITEGKAASASPRVKLHKRTWTAPAVIGRGKCMQIRKTLEGGSVPGWKEEPLNSTEDDPYMFDGPLFRVATDGNQYESYMPILTDALTPEMQRQWARMEELRLSRQCIEKEPWLRDPQELHRHPPGMVCKECVRTMTERNSTYSQTLPELRESMGRSTAASYHSKPYALPELAIDINGLQV